MSTDGRQRIAKEAQRRLARDAKAYRDAVAALDRARAKLTDAVQLATKVGVRQVDILHAIDNVWTREHVRKLTRELPWQDKETT